MTCPSCGASVIDGKKFCSKCGCSLASIQKEPEKASQDERSTPPPSVCGRCGAPFVAGKKFCSKCGNPIQWTPEASQPIVSENVMATTGNAMPTSRSKGKPLLIAGACIALLTIVAVAALKDKISFGSASSSGDTSTASADSTASTGSTSRASTSSSKPSATGASQKERDEESIIEDSILPSIQAELLIRPQYDAVTGFDDYDVARVKIGDYWQLIDENNNTLSSQNYFSINYFYEDLAVVDRGGKFGYIDTNGQEVIPPQYDNAFSFSEGLARVFKGGKYGYIHTDGSVAINFEYSSAKGFGNGYAPVSTGQGFFFINQNGDICSSTYEDANPFNIGYAAVKINGKWGYVNMAFDLVIPAIYDSAEQFSVDGLAIVEQDKKQFYIDIQGDRFTSAFDQVWNFSEGYATALLDERYGYIDLDTGELAVSIQYEDVYGCSSGLFAVMLPNKQWVYINPDNEIQFDGNSWDEAFKFYGGLAKVQQDGLYGFIDENGRLVVEPEWDDAHFCASDMIGVCRDGKWGFIRIERDN